MEGVVSVIIVVIDITYAFYFVCFRSLQKKILKGRKHCPKLTSKRHVGGLSTGATSFYF